MHWLALASLHSNYIAPTNFNLYLRITCVYFTLICSHLTCTDENFTAREIERNYEFYGELDPG